MDIPVWQAAEGSTVSLSVSTSSARVSLGAPVDNLVQLKVTTDVLIFIDFGDSTVTAELTDDPIGVGQQIVTIPPKTTHVAAITASGTGTAYFTLGYGI